MNLVIDFVYLRWTGLRSADRHRRQDVELHGAPTVDVGL